MNESWHLLRLSTPKLQLITEDVTQARAHPADIAKFKTPLRRVCDPT
jgi:hypothetical protein